MTITSMSEAYSLSVCIFFCAIKKSNSAGLTLSSVFDRTEHENTLITVLSHYI